MLKTKWISWILLISCMLFVLCSCGASDELQEKSKGNTDTGISDAVKGDRKILIAYFSRADENYGVGYIEKGNTAIIAEMIAE